MRCPVIVQRESKSAGALGGVIIKIDSSEVAKIQNGKSVKLFVEEGNHTISFCVGRKAIKTLNFSAFPDQDEIFIKCYIKSNWGITPVIEAYISNVVVATDRTNDNGTQTNNKSAWKQIPLLVRIVIWIFAIGFLWQFIVGFFWGMSIGL